MYKFLNEDSIIYILQFGFRQKYSISFALIYLTETIKVVFDQGKYDCGNFVDLQKVFDRVDHNILMGKLKHYGIRAVAYSWFDSYLKETKNCMFQSMDVTLKICRFLMVFHKILFLDYY